ncbi:hypothetical protein GGX14DRAFT_395903 [Mycena pura]|uniref:Uncharacterized protein n=1 Tax=Mycena pura TaxID=153505 RepID=A0AAD6VFH5_9AGAR|nr:hypothetical protein GGX14DRAFT_395903 [Mycena pura]
MAGAGIAGTGTCTRRSRQRMPARSRMQTTTCGGGGVTVHQWMFHTPLAQNRHTAQSLYTWPAVPCVHACPLVTLSHKEQAKEIFRLHPSAGRASTVCARQRRTAVGNAKRDRPPAQGLPAVDHAPSLASERGKRPQPSDRQMPSRDLRLEESATRSRSWSPCMIVTISATASWAPSIVQTFRRRQVRVPVDAQGEEQARGVGVGVAATGKSGAARRPRGCKKRPARADVRGACAAARAGGRPRMGANEARRGDARLQRGRRVHREGRGRAAQDVQRAADDEQHDVTADRDADYAADVVNEATGAHACATRWTRACQLRTCAKKRVESAVRGEKRGAQPPNCVIPTAWPWLPGNCRRYRSTCMPRIAEFEITCEVLLRSIKRNESIQESSAEITQLSRRGGAIKFLERSWAAWFLACPAWSLLGASGHGTHVDGHSPQSCTMGMMLSRVVGDADFFPPGHGASPEAVQDIYLITWWGACQNVGMAMTKSACRTCSGYGAIIIMSGSSHLDLDDLLPVPWGPISGQVMGPVAHVPLLLHSIAGAMLWVGDIDLILECFLSDEVPTTLCGRRCGETTADSSSTRPQGVAIVVVSGVGGGGWRERSDRQRNHGDQCVNEYQSPKTEVSRFA